MFIQNKIIFRSRTLLKLFFMSCLLIGCAVNPVTGKNELSLVSAQQEVQIGESNYQPSQQTQGGVYYLDSELVAYVQQVGKKLAQKSDRPELPYDFVILNNSIPNAWALPGGKIAVNRGLLLELEDESQLAAVLGHEIVHAAARHGAKQMTKGMIMGTGVQLVGLAAEQKGLGDWVVAGANIGANLLQTKYGREQELESDRYGMDYMGRAGYDPVGAVKLQETFLRLSEGRNPSWLEGLFASHPPSSERLNANKKHAAELPPGATNRDVYQAKISQIKHDAPAYKAYDQGVKALQNKNATQALQKAEEALKIQPTEGIFHELKGRAIQVEGDKNAALQAYTQAINVNPKYFSHYLSRGLLRKEMGDLAGAQQDLDNSNKLLPTSIANYAQGELALASNNVQAAMGYFATAGQSNTEIGHAARQQLARFELPKQPEKYLKVQPAVSKQGELLVVVLNQSDVDVSNVSLMVIKTNTQTRQAQQQVIAIPGVIAAGKNSTPVKTAFTPPGPQDSLQAKVLDAKVR